MVATISVRTFCYFLLSLCLAKQGVASNVPDAEMIEAVAAVDSTGLGSTAMLDLGALELGKDYDVCCTIWNNTGLTVKISSAITSSGCTYRSPPVEIEPGVTGEVHFKIETGKSPRRPIVGLSLQLCGKDPRETVTTLLIRYQLAGLVDFSKDLFVWEIVGPADARISVPVIATPPAELSTLTVEFSKELKGVVDYKWDAESEAGGMLVLSLKDDAKSIKKPLMGSIVLKGKQESSTCVCSLLVRSRHAIQVLPASLYFRDSETDPDNLVATAVIRLDENAFRSKIGVAPATMISAKMSVGELELAVELTQLSQFSYRALVTLPRSMIDDNELPDSDIGMNSGSMEVEYIVSAGAISDSGSIRANFLEQ